MRIVAGPISRVYSFRDVVGLRTIATLLNKHGIGLRDLREVGAWLSRHEETPWASLTFYVGGKSVFFDDSATGLRMAGYPPDQIAMPIAMEQIVRDVRAAAEELRTRGPDQIGHIERHRNVVHNAPVLAGTRIPTAAIWDFYLAGYDTDGIIREYPRLTAADVCEAITYEEQCHRKRVG